jgi:hypothetical protein
MVDQELVVAACRASDAAPARMRYDAAGSLTEAEYHDTGPEPVHVAESVR